MPGGVQFYLRTSSSPKRLVAIGNNFVTYIIPQRPIARKNKKERYPDIASVSRSSVFWLLQAPD